jgi:uncharacterized protein YkwD
MTGPVVNSLAKPGPTKATSILAVILAAILGALGGKQLPSGPPSVPPPATRPQPPPVPTPIPVPTPPPKVDPPAGPSIDGLSAALLGCHNEARIKAKLPPLTIDPQLTRAAQAHAVAMAKAQVMSHGNLGDGDFPDRIFAAGYPPRSAVAENIAWGQPDAETAFADWMDSAGHRANILGPYTQCGFGTAMVAGRIYWCADFGTPAR